MGAVEFFDRLEEQLVDRAAALSGTCPFCFLSDCTVDHQPCSPPRDGPPRPRPSIAADPLICRGCGTRLREPAALCGFCIAEAECDG